MNYRKKVMLMLGVLSYLNLGTFSQAAPAAVGGTSIPGVQQASNDKKAIKISGLVKDAAGEPIIGATILEKGTSNGVVSDMDGNFTMNVSANAVCIFHI
ncbi:carboxypeptidase-like regulatory domain-containing protein [Bacteroides stercorirosoris]|uniref:carboxypeptidase-like regulatory domain-containing protein n=1 Tax=Bacteroides stercorirosoris TaxID=871324 RepID=UPI001FB0B8C6|nr:carboxypeptidase-like regulatory domain-containing protein [Bacteroides stercorirosoris]